MARIACIWLMSCLLIPTVVLAQRLTEDNNNLWITYLGDHRISKHWSFHTEAHWRRAELGQRWQQLLLRPAVNYHLNDKVMLTLGYSYYTTYSYGDYPLRFATPEHHMYEQVQWKESLGRLLVQHRYRLEQRYVAVMVPGSDGNGVLDHYRYLNRFRYRLLLTFPLSKPQLAKDVWFASAYDEIFLTFGDAARTDGIQQNRISALIGYQLDGKGSSIQMGYLHQNLNRPDINLMEANHTLHFIFTYNLDFRRPTK